MKNLMKYIDNQSFLSELLDKNLSEPTSQLGDFWCGIACIINIIQHKHLRYIKKLYKLNANFCFISDRSKNFMPFFIFCNELIDDQEVFKLYLNICDLDLKDLQKIRDNYILNTVERKKYDRNSRIKSYIFGSSINDYINILGSTSEKDNGTLSYTIPVVVTAQKRYDTGEPTCREPEQYYSQLIRFGQQDTNFSITAAGFQQYNEWCIHHIPTRGYYGQILDDIIEHYCLIVACCLAFNDKKYTVTEDDVKNSIKVLKITIDEALSMFENELNINKNSVYLKVLEKVKQQLLIAGTNGIQHRTLYLKVHHDIDNETFKYLITLLHEMGLIEKLKVSHNSMIYRACDALRNCNIEEFMKEINLNL